jgi:hypothetical protein
MSLPPRARRTAALCTVAVLPVALPLLPALLPPLLLPASVCLFCPGLLLFPSSVVCCCCVCFTRRATATLAQDGSDSEAAGRASLGFGGVVVRCCVCCLPLPPSSSFPTIAEAPAPGTREHGVMESGIERSARLDGPAGWPRGSKSRAAREKGLNQKPKLDRSGSIPQRLGASFPPFLMTGHSGGHIEIVLPGPLGGDGHVSGKVTDPGRDFTSRYETTLPQDTASYPLLVVAPPPSDRWWWWWWWWWWWCPLPGEVEVASVAVRRGGHRRPGLPWQWLRLEGSRLTGAAAIAREWAGAPPGGSGEEGRLGFPVWGALAASPASDVRRAPGDCGGGTHIIR